MRLLAAALMAMLALLDPAAAQIAVAPPAEAAGLALSERGAGDYRHFGFLIYRARLWTGTNFRPARYADSPLLLELRYARGLRGSAIAERSLVEMQRQGPLDEALAARWLAEMQQAFPDVSEGDRLSGLLRPGLPTRFFLNGKPTAEIEGTEFARRFFGIWLAPQSSASGLRQALAGNDAP